MFFDNNLEVASHFSTRFWTLIMLVWPSTQYSLFIYCFLLFLLLSNIITFRKRPSFYTGSIKSSTFLPSFWWHHINTFQHFVLCVSTQEFRYNAANYTTHNMTSLIKIFSQYWELLERLVKFMAAHFCISVLQPTPAYLLQGCWWLQAVLLHTAHRAIPPTSFTNQIFLSALWEESGAFTHVNLT